MAGEFDMLNVLTPDAPAAVLLRAIADYNRLWVRAEGWADYLRALAIEAQDAETDKALDAIY